jgi:hypothetical protein
VRVEAPAGPPVSISVPPEAVPIDDRAREGAIAGADRNDWPALVDASWWHGATEAMGAPRTPQRCR